MLFLHWLAVCVYRSTRMHWALRIHKGVVVVAIHWTVRIAGWVKCTLSMWWSVGMHWILYGCYRGGVDGMWWPCRLLCLECDGISLHPMVSDICKNNRWSNVNTSSAYYLMFHKPYNRMPHTFGVYCTLVTFKKSKYIIIGGVMPCDCGPIPWTLLGQIVLQILQSYMSAQSCLWRNA